MQIQIRSDRVGERYKANCGKYMTIVAYRGCDDIDIQFEDGTIRRSIRYSDFRVGRVAYINERGQRFTADRLNRKGISFYTPELKDRTGERNINKQGRVITIVRYRRCDDIDVQFEDGVVSEHKIYEAFKLGNIPHPNDKPNIEERVGEHIVTNMGLSGIITDYNGTHNTTFKFTDGTIVYGCDYSRLHKGVLRHPKYKKCIKIDSDNLESYQCTCRVCGSAHILKLKDMKDFKCNRHIGETSLSKDNIHIKIIEFRSKNSIDIQMDNNNIIMGVSYNKFINNQVVCKNFRQFSEDQYKEQLKFVKSTYNKGIHAKLKKDRIGEIRYNTQGIKMELVDYRGANDIDIKLEDGTMIYNRTYNAFNIGEIKHPDIRIRRKNSILVNDECTMNNGLKLKCIDRGPELSNKATFQFEDGTIVEKTSRMFKSKSIAHPKYFRCKEAYQYENKKYFLCTCKICKNQHVLAIEEMKDFQCSNIKL